MYTKRELRVCIPNGDFMCVYQTRTLCMLNGEFVYPKRGLCVCEAGKLCIPTGEYPVRSSKTCN